MRDLLRVCDDEGTKRETARKIAGIICEEKEVLSLGKVLFDDISVVGHDSKIECLFITQSNWL